MNNMTLPKFEKKTCFRKYTYTFDNTKATSDQKRCGRKKLW